MSIEFSGGMTDDERIISTRQLSEDETENSLRPKSMADYIGQKKAKENLSIYIQAAKMRGESLDHTLLYGPPGLGKTTLAGIIAAEMGVNIRVTSGPAIEKAGDLAALLTNLSENDILFIDEIHRFNKSQQDALLPYVEDGTIILIGATTENPYFEVNKALVSRSIIFELKALSIENIKTIIKRALTDVEKGLGVYNAVIDDDALEFLANTANGDARISLNAIELAVLTTEPSSDGKIHIDIRTAEQCIQKRALNYDKDGDNHYDTISAFIKSMRGSDPNATAYYLAKMIYAGEDPKFIARRIIVCASEDVGNANPMALVVANAAMDAVNFIGLPEARINLSQAAMYVACSPKSNASINAIDMAMADVRNIKTSGVPNHLRDAHYPGAEKMGHGLGYKYAHNYNNHYVQQQYLPDELVDRVYYEMSDNGEEVKMKKWMQYIKENSNE